MSAAAAGGSFADIASLSTRRLWNLWDMLKLKSDAFIRALLALNTLWGAFLGFKFEGRGSNEVLTTKILANLEKPAIALHSALQDLEAPLAALAVSRLIDALKASAVSVVTIEGLLSQLMPRLADEFGEQCFLALTAKEARFYAVSEPPFGPDVEAKLSVSEDITEASKCIACARYTAGVFHLMRALEVGVSRFAGLLGIQPIDSRGKDKHWQNFLDEANRAIGSLPTQDQLTRKYAAISSNLYNVKLAWRNEVMHPKQTYTEEEALEVFSASKAFMRELASVL
jgi:hypothetical protein